MTTYRPAPSVATEIEDSVVYVAPVPDGPIFVLDGVSAAIWRAACSTDGGDLISRVDARVADMPGDADDAVEAFVADLVAQGLLAPATDAIGELPG